MRPPETLGVPKVFEVPVADGVRLTIRSWPTNAEGSGQGASPVLLVHGLASNARTWDEVAQDLAGRGRAVASVDLRGHGQSDKPGAGYSFATFCSDLVEVLDALAWPRAVVAGQSTGGNIALEFAVRHSDRLAGVIGVDGGLLELVDRWPVWEDCARELAPPRLEGTPAAEVEGWLRQAHPDWSAKAIAASMANFEIRPDATVLAWLDFEHHMTILRALWEHRPSALMEYLAVPATFALADTGDAWADTKRAEAARAQALNPSLTIRWFSPGDHDLHVSQPHAVADLIDALGR